MTKTRWRIQTEYIHSRHIAKIVSRYFDNYTMFSGIEHDRDSKRRCLVIEIVDHNERGEDIVKICQEINSDNHQKCCTVTSEPVFVIKLYLRT